MRKMKKQKNSREMSPCEMVVLFKKSAIAMWIVDMIVIIISPGPVHKWNVLLILAMYIFEIADNMRRIKREADASDAIQAIWMAKQEEIKEAEFKKEE